MIIDADAHVSPTVESPLSIGVDELLRRMDRAGVAKALTWLEPPYRRDTNAANAYIHRAMVSYPDRILGFGWADPNLGLAQARDTVRRCVEEYGFYGVKLNGAQNSFYIDDPALSLPVIEEIARTGRLLAFHVGADAYEQTHPYRVGKIARRFPELKILMVHMGGVGVPDLSRACIEIAQEHPNLVLIGSAVRSQPILRAVKALGAARVCFGSDTPFELMHVEVARYKALLEPDVSDEDRRNIMAGNMIRLLDLGA